MPGATDRLETTLVAVRRWSEPALYLWAAVVTLTPLVAVAALNTRVDARVFTPLLAAVVVAGVLWGVGPGLLSLTIGAVGSMLLVLTPAFSLEVADPRDVVGLVSFTLLGGVLLMFAGAHRSSQRRLDQLRAERGAETERRLEEQRAIAHALQAGLLPGAIAAPPWLAVASRYHAAGEALTVGGDFYDAFAAGGEFQLAVGDVCGKGAEAAALTAVARHTLRAAFSEGCDLTECLRAVNRRLLEEQRRPSDFLTMALAATRPEGDVVRVRLIVAGHPPPMLIRSGGVEAAAARGELLGVFTEPRFQEQELVLRPGDSLVLYTDGITEARMGAGMLGHAGLGWLLGEVASADPEGIADHTLGHVLAPQQGRPRDDIALLVAQARRPSAP